MRPSKGAQVFSIPNIQRYIAFKVLFNSRFYYPVFTILFLDFGLSVAQFSLLNAVWAATIVLAEVPSGALADTIGRKHLLIFATMTMVVEVGLIAFLPLGNSSLIFWVFLVNRVLSDLAEAAASGADEALAYDALIQQGNPDDWAKVLEVFARFQYLGFIIAMTCGAAIYDPELMTSIVNFLGVPISLTQETTMRFPLYATLLLALGACAATSGMEELHPRKGSQNRPTLKRAFALTFKASAWILSSGFVFKVILFGMLFDSIVRMVVTLSSQYYRMILLPESLFGIIGSLVAMLGFIIPKLAGKLVRTHPPDKGLWLTTGLTITGLTAMTFFWPWVGMIPALVTYGAMYFNGFFVCYYINQNTPSDQRATVLSFKGLSYNLAYGLLGTFYALVLRHQKQGLETGINTALDNQIFKETFILFPSLFLAGFISLMVICKFYGKS
ncbi:MAG: MFS transporter [Desulfobacter sp.]|nr:MFS transporter [Desulfobacter sp.]